MIANGGDVVFASSVLNILLTEPVPGKNTVNLEIKNGAELVKFTDSANNVISALYNEPLKVWSSNNSLNITVNEGVGPTDLNHIDIKLQSLASNIKLANIGDNQSQFGGVGYSVEEFAQDTIKYTSGNSSIKTVLTKV